MASAVSTEQIESDPLGSLPGPLMRQANGLAKRQGADEALPRPVVKRDPAVAKLTRMADRWLGSAC